MSARSWVVFNGSQDWCQQSVSHYAGKVDSIIRIGLSVGWTPPTKARNCLGQECDVAIYDAWAGFHPDALAIIGGCIRAGGTLVLLCPPFDQWPDTDNPEALRFQRYPDLSAPTSPNSIKRLIRKLNANQNIRIINQVNSTQPKPFEAPVVEQTNLPTDDQLRAIAAINKVVTGQRKRPALITADRGRGKSAAMGLAAAASLRQQHTRHIIVTAPHWESAQTLFLHAAQVLGLKPETETLQHLEYGNGSIRFTPIDALIENLPTADLLLIDEAAAISVPRLTTLLKHYNRVAMATTLHGYEGSGKGFSLKFEPILAQHTRGVNRVHLNQAIRWPADDWLEPALFDALLLDAEPLEVRDVLDDYSIERVDRTQLANDESHLRAVFGLLIQAHYRTRPLDLVHLLDAPGTELVQCMHNDQVVAVTVLAWEGGLSAEDAESIIRGERRPHGHLLAELLGAQMGLKVAPTLQVLRIQRIVVHPQFQRQGLGHALLTNLRKLFPEADLIGSSFGAQTELISFWQKSGMIPVRAGDKTNPISGLVSATVLQAHSDAARQVLAAAQRSFRQQFPQQLASSLQTLNPATALALFPATKQQLVLEAQTDRDLNLFAHSHRPFESVRGGLFTLAKATLNTRLAETISPIDQTLLLAAVLQHQNWEELSNIFGLKGRKAIVIRLRKIVAKLLV